MTRFALAISLLSAVACGEPVRLDECQGSDSSLDCMNCCEDFGYGDRPSSFTSATGRCTCYQERSDGGDGGGNASIPPVSGDDRCWNSFNQVLLDECENVEIGPGINTCEANFCTSAGIAANRVDAECTAYLDCWPDFDTCMAGCSSDSTRIETCRAAFSDCVTSKTR